MFKNFAASIAPKSFNLERYLAKSKQLTKINRKTAKIIEEKLQDEYSYSERTGFLASATACNGTIVTINDPELANALYVAITSDGFNEKLNAAYTHVPCFSDMKFFINKKDKEVCFVYYNCKLDRSAESLSNVYDNLLELVSLFSTSDYDIQVNYYYLFRTFLSSSNKTSFLTSFFISITNYEYKYSSDELRKIIELFLSYDKLSFDLYTQVPGMYLEFADQFFNQTSWPRNICINMLRYIYDNNFFNSYDAFFRGDDKSKILPDLENLETLNFVFNESALQEALVLESETNEMATYTVKESGNSQKYIVIKIKDVEHTKTYLDSIYACFKSNFLFTYTAVPTAAKDGIYLFLSVPNCHSLEEKISISDCSYVTTTVQAISKRDWNFSLKASTPILKCFYLDEYKLYLDPLYIHMLDFRNTGKSLDHKLIILSIIQEFVKCKNIKVDNIFTYSFMKILPPNFAKNLISYLQSGTFLDENTDNWGEVITFSELSNIRFVHNLKRLAPDLITFLPTALSDSNVQKKISKKSSLLKDDYINSPECLQYICDIGLNLTDDTLNKIFGTTDKFFLRPVKVIVSKDLCDSNSYQIVGVVWNECNLTSIGNLIQSGKVDTTVFYKLLSSLLFIQRKHDWLIDESNICQMLVDTDYHVFLNYNGLKTHQDNRMICEEVHFKNLFNALNFHCDNSIAFVPYFDLYDNGARNIAREVLLCKEHNLYYIEGYLCPECRKIYCLINKYNTVGLYGDDDWHFCYADYKNSLIATDRGLTLNTEIIKQCKLGIENGLFNKFFFKPNSLALQSDCVIGVVYYGMGNFNFNNLLPISMFKSRQRLQVIQVMYKKLLPLILDGSCITDKNDFFASIAMHKNHKGEIIILKLPLMDCEAVLAKDEDAIELTKLMFAEFLVNYIKEDPNLNAASTIKASALYELIQDIDNLNFTASILEECLSAFCDVHNVPFSSKNTLCPLCISDGISPDDIIVLPAEHFKNLQKGKPLFEGGEATLYTYSSTQIQKLFKPGVDLVFKSKIIGKALEKRNQFKAFNAEHNDIKFIVIDNVLYESNKNTINLKGFVQEEIEDSFKISCLKDKEFVSNQGYTQYDIVEILIKVCIGIEFLHFIGGYIGDLNGGNILIKGKTVYFIDMDGMSFDNVRNFVYTDMYIYPPSAESKNITKADDWYSLAIQAFYYFTYSHPFRGISSSKLVPADEITRMKRGISVLGNHGIKVPNVSIGWDFLPKELIKFFKSTFEGSKRESMRNILEHFKTTIDMPKPTNAMTFIEVNRSLPCRFALSYNTYIDTSGYLLWCEHKLLKFSSGMIGCKITGDYIILTTLDKSVVLNDTNGQFNVYSGIKRGDISYAASDKLYYISSNDHSVHVKQINSRTQQESDDIVVNASILTAFDFLVTNDQKFIFLVKNGTQVSIFCNRENLTSVDASILGKDMQSRLFYDCESGNYLVILSGYNKTIGILILSDGTHSKFTLEKEVSTSSCFYKNTLYYMIGDTIYFYNVNNGTVKEFTSQFAASGCLIERKANRFVICSKDKSYMYIKS